MNKYLKFSLFLYYGLNFFARCLLIDWRIRVEEKAIRAKTKMVSRLCRKGLRALDVHIQCVGLPAEAGGESRLYAANHQTYLDIFVLSACLELQYVSAFEVAGDPTRAGILKSAGVILVENRRHDSRLANGVGQVAQTLEKNINVAVFPEGETTNGTLKKFKPALFQAAVDAGRKVVPVSIRYTKVNGRHDPGRIRDEVCWYDDRTSWYNHLINFCGFRNVEVVVHFHDELPGAGRKELAQACEEVIREAVSG